MSDKLAELSARIDQVEFITRIEGTRRALQVAAHLDGAPIGCKATFERADLLSQFSEAEKARCVRELKERLLLHLNRGVTEHRVHVTVSPSGYLSGVHSYFVDVDLTGSRALREAQEPEAILEQPKKTAPKGDVIGLCAF